jgi:hypothetical protein
MVTRGVRERVPVGKKNAENDMSHEKRNPAENELTRFRRDLSRVAFSDEYAIGYAETVLTLLQAAATIAGCEGLNIDALADFFLEQAAQAKKVDAALNSLEDLDEIGSRVPVGDA